MSPTSESFLQVTLSEEIESEEANSMVEMLEEGLINLNLGSKAEDDDHGRLHRKKARAKKVRDKWNQLVFVPMPVLNNRDLSSGGKAGKREGFNTFNRLSCKPCGKCFRKASGLWCHPCSSSPGRQSVQRPSFKSSIPRSSASSPRPTFTKSRSPMVGSRRSSRVTKVENSYQEDDEIEIVGDTEMDKKNAEKVDKNFSKMTLKGQREAMEAFKNSTLYSTEEEVEEEVVEEPRKVVKRGRKRKVLVEEDSDSDIEILDSPTEKRISTGDASECDIGAERVLEDTSMCVSITPMSKTNSNNNNKASSLINKKPFGEELNSNGQKHDLVQVKSASGKTMMVERSKLERVMGKPLENQTSPLKRPNTRASRALENTGKCDEVANKATIKLIDNAGQPEEITFEEETEFGKMKVDLKRKAEEGDFLSRRLRRRG